MGRYATLSPIDPTIVSPYNEPHPQNPVLRLPISVEDVMAYFELAKRNGVEGDSEAAVFLRLTDKVHPLALGNVERSVNQIRELAKKMLALHAPDRDKEQTNQLIHRLTTGLYSHYHLVSRREAAEIGLPVQTPSAEVEGAMWDYYDGLVQDLELLDPFNPTEILRRAVAAGTRPRPPLTTLVGQTAQMTAERAYIETEMTCDRFVSEGTITVHAPAPVMLPGMPAPTVQPPAVSLELEREGWEIAD